MRAQPIRAHDHEVLDALIHRATGQSAGHVEATLDASPGLAKLASDLPAGHIVNIHRAPRAPQKLIQLWD